MRCYSTDGGHGEYDGDGEDDGDMMILVMMMPDGNGEDIEDAAASIFTIILCLTILHRCCSNSGYTSASMVLLKVLRIRIYYINFLIDLHKDGVVKGNYISVTRVTMNSCTKLLNIEHHLATRALPSTGNH